MKQLSNNLKEIQKKISRACNKVNRDSTTVSIVQVTKNIDVSQTKSAIHAGAKHLGENKIQQAVEKIAILRDEHASWHFIGRLQRNKAKDVIGRFTYLHSLDRYSLVVELEKQLKKNKGTLQSFIQVNVSEEKSKQGIFLHELKDFMEQISGCTSLDIVGLMTMAPKEASAKEVRGFFRELRRQRDLMQMRHPRVTQLSMGMSQDYEIAVEEGATWIRLGKALFCP